MVLTKMGVLATITWYIMKPTTTKEDTMSKKKTQNQTQTEVTNPFAALAECVGGAIVAIAMVPVLIIDAVLVSTTS
jgi:hypothetical protein